MAPPAANVSPADLSLWDRQLGTLSRGRLRVADGGPGWLTASDRLRRGPRPLSLAAVAERAPSRTVLVELLRLGFLDAALPAATRPIADAPASAADNLFWQFPARTEALAHARHAALAQAVAQGDELQVYLGLPWATWIDRTRRGGGLPDEIEHELFMQRVRIAGFRRVLQALGADLRVHTVCQHVAWRTWVPEWRRLGISDLWLAHAPAADAGFNPTGVQLHPWPLYAVNVEDPARRQGLVVGRDPAERAVLASFVGAHGPHCLSDVRLRLQTLAGEPGFEIEVTDRWHFEDTVYTHQIGGAAAPAAGAAGPAVERYNRLLSDSVFSLCPAGAGANTLRLWESLAVGSVPVLLGPAPRLPEGGTLPPIDWDAIVLRAADAQIAELPRRLRAMPLAEVRRRQQLGLQAYAQVREQRCF